MTNYLQINTKRSLAWLSIDIHNFRIDINSKHGIYHLYGLLDVNIIQHEL